MLIYQKNQDYLVNLFKIGMGIRIVCFFGKILLARYNVTDTFLVCVVNIISTAMLFITTTILTYEAIRVFNKRHTSLLYHHQHLVMIIEFIFMRIIFLALFINQKITNKFILYLNDLSTKNQKGSFVFFIIVMSFLMGRYFKRLINLNKIRFNDKGIYKILLLEKKHFLFKIFIGITTFLLMKYSPFEFLKPRNIYNFMQAEGQNIISKASHYLESNIFLYIHNLLIVGLVFWILIDMYSVYTIRKQL